jgi:DNA-binding transcriptional ArsR family regulator
MTQLNKEIQGRECSSQLGEVMDPGFFKALSDPNRIAILARLAQCCDPSTVSQVAQCCTVDMSVVSRHLAALRDAGILEAQKRGKEVYYSVRYPELVNTLRRIADAIDACCPVEKSESMEVNNE